MEGKVLLGQYLIWVMILLEQMHGYNSCIGKERKALLEIKKFMISRIEEWEHDFVLPTWTNDTKSDCCWWEGVKCNRTSKRVSKIAFGSLYVKQSSLLNLSLLYPFEDVRSLNISGCGFSGLFDDIEGYKSLRRLRNLEILDFSGNAFNNSIFPFLNAATSLETLVLQNNYLDGPFPVKELKDLTNLELLDLSGNRFNGSMPVREFPHLKKLKALDLSGNGFSSSMELQELRNLTNLEVLDLAWNNFYGPVPIEVFCEMKNLQELDLSVNNFVGQLPLCFGSLKKLSVLDLSLNRLSGNLPSSFSNLESLEYLSLSDNNFEGLFSLSPLANLTKLKVFKLSSTSQMIQVETETTWQPKFQLSVVALPLCSLERIPNFLVYQKSLRLVDLSNNKLSGDIPTWFLEKNPALEVLQLKNNSFTIFQMPTIVHNLHVLDFSANEISGLFPDNIGHALPNLVHMNGSNNGFQGHLSSSMGEMKNISFLDLSYNNFSGELPRSFVTGCFSLQILKLSHNKFSGKFLPRRTSFTSLSVLRMDNNLFTGKIGVGLLSSIKLSILDMSNNFLQGAIPSWLSQLFILDFLLISQNFLEGSIPPSLLVIPYLSFLDLSGNRLSGALPSYVKNLHGTKLFLHDNNFTGSVPNTLLGSVEILDLRNNKLSGSIPQFVNTQDISILLLRGNELTGSIPKAICDLSNIRLLDLSDNKLNGLIPPCLNNISFGVGEEEMRSSYIAAVSTVRSLEYGFYEATFVFDDFVLEHFTYLEVEIQFAAKQRYDSYSGSSEFSGGTLDYMYGLDLSSNNLTGVIPAELGDLSKLRAMNLSRNFLWSRIPDSFSKLKDIESLDLSYNMLHGSIPHQLTNLTSLAVFSVSYNNLSGIIPQGGQFNTFNENSYLGNPLLCGPPTDRSCEAKTSPEETDDGEEDEEEAVIDMLVFYWSTASTYVTALVGILLLMCFDCSWRRAWLRLVDAFVVSAKSMLS